MQYKSLTVGPCPNMEAIEKVMVRCVEECAYAICQKISGNKGYESRTPAERVPVLHDIIKICALLETRIRERARADAERTGQELYEVDLVPSLTIEQKPPF